MKTHLMTAAAALFASNPVLAAPHAGSAFVQDYDTDRDGRVTRGEFDTMRVRRFQATDANKDGWVSEQEYVAEYSSRLERQLAASNETVENKAQERQRQMRQAHVRFNALDRDKDAKMTQAEFDVSGSRVFAEQDGDKDGTVTQADVAATAAQRQIAREKAN